MPPRNPEACMRKPPAPEMREGRGLHRDRDTEQPTGHPIVGLNKPMELARFFAVPVTAWEVLESLGVGQVLRPDPPAHLVLGIAIGSPVDGRHLCTPLHANVQVPVNNAAQASSNSW